MQARQRYCHTPNYIHRQMKTVVENVENLQMLKAALRRVYENSTSPLQVELVLSLKWQLKTLPFLESFFDVCTCHSVKLNGYKLSKSQTFQAIRSFCFFCIKLVDVSYAPFMSYFSKNINKSGICLRSLRRMTRVVRLILFG